MRYFFHFPFPQEFPGLLLPHIYVDPENPLHLLTRSEVERRIDYIQQLYKQIGEEHPLFYLVYDCLHNTPDRRPSAKELLQRIREPNVSMVRMVNSTEIRNMQEEVGHLEQRMKQLEVGVIIV